MFVSQVFSSTNPAIEFYKIDNYCIIMYNGGAVFWSSAIIDRACQWLDNNHRPGLS